MEVETVKNLNHLGPEYTLGKKVEDFRVKNLNHVGPEYTPGKKVEDFRVYDKSIDPGVADHYKQMRMYQTIEFVKYVEENIYTFDHFNLTVQEAFEKLKTFVDRSDPDTSLPNLEHMIQTAERAREKNKPDWFVLTCLIHDMGKMCFLIGDGSIGMSGEANGAQYALGGDTFVVGCKIPDCTVFPEFNHLNPDSAHPIYSTEMGIYEANCGLHNLKFAAGHDEYMYRFVLANKDSCKLAEIPEALAMLRFHSCYPLHTHRAYDRFLAPGDEKLIEAVLDFNQFDLYSKSDSRPDLNALWPYYQSLIDKYMPGKLKW
jgi:inositol oxygenase